MTQSSAVPPPALDVPDRSTTPTPDRSGASARELAVVAAIMAGVIAVLPLVGGATLWTHPFWLDEWCCTIFPVSDSRSLLELFGNVRRDDVAPPLLHVIVWAFGRMAGTLSPVVVRSVMLVCVAFALFALYAALRRRFGRSPSAAAVLAVAGHTLVIHHAFEARFYGPWLLFGAAYAWAVGIDAHQTRSHRRDAAQAVLAICLCTIHWFGITSLALMATGACATFGRRWRDGLRFVAPSVAGPVVLALLLPMMRAQLGQGGSDLLWIPPLNISQVANFVWLFFIRLPLVLALLLLVVDRVRRRGAHPAIAPVVRSPAFAAMLSLALMPLVLVLITVVLEPVMVPRYAILAVLAMAPVVALSFETIGRLGRGVVTALFTLILVLYTDKEIRYSRDFAAHTAAYAAELQRASVSGVPIVFESYFLMYAVDGASRANSITRFLQLPDSTLKSLFPDSSVASSRWRTRLFRNQALLHNRVFGFPIPITQARLDSTPRFYLFAADEDLPPGHRDALEFGQQLFPRHRVTRLNRFVTAFELVP